MSDIVLNMFKQHYIYSSEQSCKVLLFPFSRQRNQGLERLNNYEQNYTVHDRARIQIQI